MGQFSVRAERQRLPERVRARGGLRGACLWLHHQWKGFRSEGRWEVRETGACAESYVNQSERTEGNLRAPGVRVHVCACACVLG